ncbi:MAG TPA: phosphotransferase [Novosphingobium sp.]|nr:phosphotransferase [Novosphingobium sp.]
MLKQDLAVRPLPIVIEEITPEWLTAALRTRVAEATVVGMQILEVIGGTCTKVRLQLELNEAARRAGIAERVVLKGGFEKHSRQFPHRHELEVRAYRDVLPALELPSPACFFAEYSQDQLQGIVIMEDLAVRGVTFCQIQKPQTHDQVAQRLTVLARFHAKTWDSPEFHMGRWEWVPNALPQYLKRNSRYLEPETWRRFLDTPQAAAASVRFHDSVWMEQALTKIVNYSQVRPHVLLHGDCHPGNLYIDVDGTPSFFDPAPSRAPFMRDVGYHIGAALDTAERRKWEAALLQHYLDELRWNGVNPPDFDETLFDYGVYLALSYFIWLINETHYQSPANNTACVARFSAAMIDHDTIALLRKLD